MTRHIQNENIPYNSLAMRAFNLTEGAAFMPTWEPDPRVWIAERIVIDSDFERVFVWAHDGTDHPTLTNERAFDLDFNELVALVGIVRNPTDRDDNDWGSDSVRPS